MGNLKIIILLLVPFFTIAQNYPRFELYQLKQGTDSGQFIVTGLDSNLAFNNILRFRSADSTFLIGTDTVITDQSIIPILLRTIDAGLGIDVNQVDNQIFIESLSIEDSIYNGTASLISKGTPLYAVGVQGNYWSTAPADASDSSKMPVVVIAGEDIGAGATGLGLIKGHIKQVNTTGLADGAEVYVASGGGYTSTKPTAEGVIIQRLGTVIKGNSANGSGIINLGDEAYWNDYVDRIELGDTVTQLRTDLVSDNLTENYMWIGNASNQTSEILATDERTGNTIIKRDASGKFKSNFIEVNNGWGNVGIGFQVFNSINDRNYFNTAVGHNSGTNLTSGDRNTFYGWNSGNNVTTGAYNTFIGTSTGSGYTTTGSNNTLIGYDAQPNSATDDNSISIGYQARGNGSNTIVIGNSSNTSLQANNYKFNIDQDLTGKNGFQLTYNSATMEIELDSAGGGGGAVGGIDSVITDQVTILGNGVDQTLRVDTTNTIATKQFVLDNSGGSGTSPWTIDGANIYYNSGNVGIGNNSPNYKLHVTGTSFVDGSLLVDNTLYLGNGTGTQYPYILGTAGKMYFNSYDVLTNGALYTFTDRVGNVEPLILYGTTAANQMVVQGNSNLNGELNVEGNFSQTGSFLHDGGNITFNNTQQNYDFGIFSDNCCTSTPFMWVDASADKVQIGTGNPQYTLDVTGDINFTGDLYDNGSLVSFTGTTINNNADNRIITGSNTANTLNGETGLTWDGDSLQVSGDMRVNNEATFTLYNTYNLSSLAGQIELENDNGKVYLDYNGNFTITSLSGSGVIDIGANNVGVLEPYTSDTTLKTNILPNQYGLKKVMDLETIKFNWKDKDSKGSQNEVGFNAQNLEKVIPEATYTIPSNGKLGIKDDAIIATLTKAIQEQQEMIEELQK